MAIDTRSRRAAVLGIAQAITLTLPLSDGAVGQEDRYHVAFSYPGIVANSPIPVPDLISMSGVAFTKPELESVAFGHPQLTNVTWEHAQ